MSCRYEMLGLLSKKAALPFSAFAFYYYYPRVRAGNAALHGGVHRS